jgi:uncharacterized membrane protein YfcA
MSPNSSGASQVSHPASSGTEKQSSRFWVWTRRITVGLILAIANVTGAIIGSKLAIRGGSPLVRKVFLIMTFLLIAKVGYDWYSNK